MKLKHHTTENMCCLGSYIMVYWVIACGYFSEDFFVDESDYCHFTS